jgi:hypothetical protein
MLKAIKQHKWGGGNYLTQGCISVKIQAEIGANTFLVIYK